MCACVCIYVSSSLCYLQLSFLAIYLLSPSFLSATQTSSSHPPVSPFAIVLSRLLYKDFTLAKTFACWANSPATVCYGTAAPLDAFLILSMAQEKVRNGWWSLSDALMPSPFYTTKRASREIACLPAAGLVVPLCWCQAPAGRLWSCLACDCRKKNSFKKNKTKLSCPLVSFILTTPVSMAKTSSFSLSSTWTWGQGEYNEMRKLGNSHPKELKSISSESRTLTAHPLLFYFCFF